MPTTLRLPPVPRHERRSLAIRERARTLHPEGSRRLLNVAVAALGLALCLPVLALVALLIKVNSRGPVLFRQTRIGVERRSLSRAGGNTRRHFDLGGRPFTMYKFRTMYHQPSTGQQIWAQPDDHRVTPVGRLLRRYRLDELPQLWNVLRGDMNIVGPRPEQPDIFVYLRERVPGYHRRQRARPGITGWAQIQQGYDRTLEDVQRKVAFDLEYLACQSLGEDLRIMVRTLPVMLFRRGAW